MNYYSLIAKYGLNEIKEQKEFLTNPLFENPENPVVLAGGTGFGKTFTTILKLIMFYMNPKNKGKKTIILPSSTKVLRNNFGESMDVFNNLPFTYCVCTGKRDFKNAVKGDCDVIIVLPQTLANIEELPKVEWLVVDEAHKWYFAKTIGEIIAKTKPSYQLLLTGTPFKFNANKREYTIFYVPIEDMIAAGNVGNPLIEVVSSSINLKDDDFVGDDDDVRRDLKWSYKEDKDQLVSVAKEINKTLKTRMRKTTIGRMLGVFGIEKTIIYCYSKKQARHFYKAFQKSDLAGKVLLSDSESDINSTEFNKFKEEEDYRVLLVVDRGKEGFDMPELFNIVDFTLSTNPEIILQILGRVFRISKLQPNKQKTYYKVASMNTASFILTLMTGVLQLVNREYYETFTGKFSDLKVPVMPRKKTKVKGETNKNRNNFSTRALQYFQDVNIPLTANFWNQLSFKQGDIWKTMGQTTIKQVLSEMAGRKGYSFLTKDYYDYVINTYKIKTYNQLDKIDSSLAKKAAKMGWDTELKKSELRKGNKVTATVPELIQWMDDNNITLYKEFQHKEKGQAYRTIYSGYLAEGKIDDIAPKSKSGIKKGHTYTEEQKKKISEGRRKAWSDPNKYQSRNRSNNFTLKTK